MWSDACSPVEAFKPTLHAALCRESTGTVRLHRGFELNGDAKSAFIHSGFDVSLMGAKVGGKNAESTYSSFLQSSGLSKNVNKAKNMYDFLLQNTKPQEHRYNTSF